MRLQPDKTFDNFVIGNNAFAYQTLLSVADGRAKYNPILIWGPDGTGKSHLLSALGARLLEHHPSSEVALVAGVNLREELRQAVRHPEVPARLFEKYGAVKALLVDEWDDALGEPEANRLLTELFRVVRAYGHFVVLTSSCYFKDTENITGGLCSFLDEGLTLPLDFLSAPERGEVLRRQCEASGMKVSPAVALAMARSLPSSLHAVEGAAQRLQALRVFLRHDVQLADLERHFGVERSVLQFADILRAVASDYNVKEADIRGPRRVRRLVVPRHVAMHLTRQGMSLSLPEIGRHFGRDHTTIIHAIRRVEEDMRTKTAFRERVLRIAKSLHIELDPIPLAS